MDDLNVSRSERVILEALFIAPDLPDIQARAGVILRTADGVGDEQIGTEFAMRHNDVSHWRKRFQVNGIRGLWDVPGPGPKRKVTPEKEQAIIHDVLYSAYHWDAKLLAKRYGVSCSAIHRVFAKHGIVRGRWGRIDIQYLKVLPEPLFGLTLSGIVGLYHGGSAVLALASTSRPFSELDFVASSTSVLQQINGLPAALADLSKFWQNKLGSAPRLTGSEETIFIGWLDRLEQRRQPQSDTHLLCDLPHLPPLRIPCVQGWLTEHQHFTIHYAPLLRDLCWPVFVRRWFSLIVALPTQNRFVKCAAELTKYLAKLSDEERLMVLAITLATQVVSRPGS